MRNKNRGTFENVSQATIRRGNAVVTQFASPEPIFLPPEFLETLTYSEVVWQSNTKLWKLAEAHYGDPQFWWVIALYNNKPTDAHFVLGDIVLIPTPIERILSFTGNY